MAYQGSCLRNFSHSFQDNDLKLAAKYVPLIQLEIWPYKHGIVWFIDVFLFVSIFVAAGFRNMHLWQPGIIFVIYEHW